MAELRSPSADTANVRRSVCIFDRRPDSKVSAEKMINISGIDYRHFLQAVRKVFCISANDVFVLTTTDRREINKDIYGELADGKTLHLLRSVDQELSMATQERIKYVPHYHTIVQSGQYEYYASEGQKALPYAFAELIDNALSATSCNKEIRRIEIRLLFDDSQGGPAVVVMDNGRGMTSKELNNWAVYRLSKFSRDDGTFKSDHTGYIRPGPVPRSLNSDISYFGVGGKQAVFYIGQSVRIITKPVASLDVHEFVMSKEEFERKEKNKEEIYSGIIRNRKPGDDSHVRVDEERFLQSLIVEEYDKDSFTTIVISGIQPEHVSYLKHDFTLWTRELAHIYHYYVHGVHGNEMKIQRSQDSSSNIDIQICLMERSPRSPRLLNLREVANDMQTLYINSSVAEFEFKASRGGGAIVEGVIRYHPFLYDSETYPEDPYAATPAVENDDDDDCIVLYAEGRGKRPIFECFWNGRLIPYSSVDEFEWCARPKKASNIPLECYNRISGALFTNDRFQVSTNKLTFMDLELQLRDKETIFTRVLNGQEQRVKINREFTAWLKDCHERYDKQVKFLDHQGVTTRTDISTKRLQSPWAIYNSIQWDRKTYKSGQYVKSLKTQPILYGSIINFLLYGDHDGDVFATGGHVQIALEPQELHNEKKIIPISKIDRQATAAAIKKSVDDELAKLPEQLKITWPDGNPWPDKAVRPAGTPMGPIKVEILNKKGESMSRLPVANVKKLGIDLQVIWHSPKGDVKTNSHIGVHSSKWEYWFKVMENLNKLGKYTLHLQTILIESSASELGRKRLPYHTLHFTIKESSAVAFVLGAVPTFVQVGVPFSLPLEFKDGFEHTAQPPSEVKPQLECSSLELSYQRTASTGTAFSIQDLRAMGKVKINSEKMHTVKVTIPGLKQDSDTFQISVRPGPPHMLMVSPDGEVSIENGTPAAFRVEVLDEFKNITTSSKLIVRCQLSGAPDLPVDTVDCSNTGTGMLLAKPVQLKNVKTEQVLTAKFGIPNQKAVCSVERALRVLPSTRVFRVEVYRQEAGSQDAMAIGNMERIDWTAGDALGSLRFRLYDEGDRLVPLTPKLARNVKVSWTADVKEAELTKGMLPDVCVPTKVQGEQFYQVAFRDQQSIETSFFIVPRPDQPERLRVTLSKTTARLGETLTGNISVEVVDQYGNKTEALNAESMKNLTVNADDLDASAISIDWQSSTSTVLVQGVCFVSGAPGPRELCFKYQELEEFARVKVTAGAPSKLILLEAPEMPIHVINGQGLENPFLLQLCDDWGNAVNDQRFVISLKALSSKLKLKSPVMSQPVDVEGRARFTLETVTAKKGEYELEFRASFSRNSITGPTVQLLVLPDPNNPVSLNVDYNNETVLAAGDNFPVFKVTVVSEEGNPIKNISPANLSMLLWQGSANGSRPPDGVTTLKCTKTKDKEKDEDFYFRDKLIPDRVGKYIVQFVLVVDKSRCLWSSQIALNVVANKPEKLVPETPPATPVVSNCTSLANRTLLDSLCLKIMDRYNNPAGVGINGQVIATVLSDEASDPKSIPLFENGAKSLPFKLTNGEAMITNLALKESSPGVDGAEYTLQFRPLFEGNELKIVGPFKLPFRFYNDAENQKAMSAMSKKKDQLSLSIDMYKGILDTHKQLASELESQLKVANSKESRLKSEMIKCGLDITKLSSVSEIESLIAQKKAELGGMQHQPRRKCTMPDPFKGSPDVLGKIAHLAQVEDDDVAKVISWHLLGDMDCVVTVTTAAAKKIYDDTQGRQQVMPMETVFWKPSNRPLPHIRKGGCGCLFRPVGNPVFVRDLLIFPEHAESCNMVFSSLLGDTILVDDLDSANHYRKGVVQNNMQCPTLLTRQGERIRSNGKFGGLQNKAPPIEKLRGQVFGAPLSKEHVAINKQIELLQQYSAAVAKAAEVKADYDSHIQYLQSPQMKQKEEELQQHKDELQDIEEKLASTPRRTPNASVSSLKRNLAEETDESLPTKRVRRKTQKLDS